MVPSWENCKCVVIKMGKVEGTKVFVQTRNGERKRERERAFYVFPLVNAQNKCTAFLRLLSCTWLQVIYQVLENDLVLFDIYTSNGGGGGTLWNPTM